ncbi:MAG: glycosyltransferase family 2 protein [Planctomycetota bacterium]
MGKKSTLSFCIITQDMAHFLGHTLENIVDLADEIVVVDGGSVDGTIELARQFQRVRLIQRRFDGNFAAQKNFAMDAATSDWVMIIDADELLSDRLRAQIPRLIASRFLDWYKFPRYWVVSATPWRFVKSEKHYPDFQLRLFRNDRFFRYPDRSIVHTHFPREGRGLGRKVRDGHIFHCDFMLKGRRQRERKVQWYLKLDPPSAETSQMYLYEDRPFELVLCEDRVSTLSASRLTMLEQDLRARRDGEVAMPQPMKAAASS